MKKFLIYIIKFYKRCISPHMEHRCRFVPTCSTYALEAIEIHGVFKGLILTLWRLFRCNPLFRAGFDPVPPSTK